MGMPGIAHVDNGLGLQTEASLGISVNARDTLQFNIHQAIVGWQNDVSIFEFFCRFTGVF
jgi:hypothetical protein